MQAIETRFCGPTDHNGSRISAACQAGRIIVTYEHELNLDQNHVSAAKQLRDKLNWSHKMASGTLRNGNFVHVLLDD